ncbi:MAG TPA: SCO family protein [Gaiellaceae bacterium]|nr:SCO family protein [Gaiellaceae bacterium]
MERASLKRAAAALAAALALVAPAAAAGPPRFDGPTIQNPRRPPDFALFDQQGHRDELYALRGKVVLLTFLYTHCIDVCPLTAARLNGALHLLGRARSRVRVLAVSVDPKADTPRSVQAFIRLHRLLPQIRYLTGTRRILAPIWQAFGVESTAQAGDHVDHTLYTLLIDRAGRGRVLYDSTATSSEVAHDVRLLLAR